MSGIVVGVDGSEHSLDALRWAAEEAKLRKVPLRAVAAFATPLMSTGYEVAVPDSSDLAAASTTMLGAAVDTVRGEGRPTVPGRGACCGGGRYAGGRRCGGRWLGGT